MNFFIFLPRTIARAALVATALILGTFAVRATPIDVPNASFEIYSYPWWTTTNTAIASGWVFNVNGGSQYGVASINSNFSSEGAASGSSYAYINNDDPGVVDTITSASSLGIITADTTYTLTTAVGNISASDTGIYSQPGPVALSLLANGQVFATTTIHNGSVSNGTFQDFSLTYTTPDTSSIIGENLTIQLATEPEHGTAYVGAFDNVTLDEVQVEAAPEPSISLLLMLAGAMLIGLTLLRRFTSRSIKGGAAFATCVLAGLLSVSADPVDVPNGSFETSPSGGGWGPSNPDIISNWTFNAPAGSEYGQLWNIFFTSGSSGSYSAFIDNTSADQEATITSAAPLETIAADTTYTLTVAVGNPDLNNPAMEEGPLVFDPVADTAPSGVFLALLADGQPFAIQPIPAGLEAGGTFQDFSFSYTTTNSDPIDGQQLTIQLGTEPGSAGAASFDNVRLDAVDNDVVVAGNTDDDGSGSGTAPEPSALGLLGFGGLALGCLMRWKGLNSDLPI